MEYPFTLKYPLSEHDASHNELVERLGASGCDDALVGVGQPGRLALEFNRAADSAELAVMQVNLAKEVCRRRPKVRSKVRREIRSFFA